MADEINPTQETTPGYATAEEQNPIPPRKALRGAVVVVLILIALAAAGILHRIHAKRLLTEQTNTLAAPTVSVAAPKLGAPIDNFVLPGNVTAYTDSPIYARANGYLLHWYYDIGAKVKKGALLAVIDTPELDRQVAQAQADLATAQANANIAHIQAQRYSGLVKSDAVSQQDTDTFVNQATATASAVKSAKANLDRLRQMQGFERIYAPFDGVVTARAVDTGQLITEGSASELFHLQAVGTLRVYTNVPQIYSQSLKPGMKIPVTFPEHAGKSYEGTLVRTADAIDPASRTLLVEVDLDNRAGELLPGSLAQVHFKAPPASQAFVVPAAALIFHREGARVAVAVTGSQGTVVHLLPVTISEDDGASVQIVTGISLGDQVIQDPPDSLIDGEKVTVVAPGGLAKRGA